MMEFISAAANTLLTVLYAPTEMMASGSIGLQIMGGIFALGYTGVAAACSALAWKSVKNPQYTYYDRDPKTGKTTTVDVSPSKDLVFHRLSNDLTTVIDFRHETICDIKTSHSTTDDMLIPMSIGGITTHTMMSSTKEDSAVSNMRSFNNASTRADKAEIESMRIYWKKAEKSFSNRTFKMFN